MRRAASRAAIRRGSSTTTSPLTISSSAGGTRVVLPAPGGASITRLGERLRDSMISGRIASTGRTGLLFTNFHRNTPTRTRQRGTLSFAFENSPRNKPTGTPHLARSSRDVGCHSPNLAVPRSTGRKHQGSWYPTSREKRARCGAPVGSLQVEVPNRFVGGKNSKSDLLRKGCPKSSGLRQLLLSD